MVIKTVQTKDGNEEKELTPEEVISFAEAGDKECLREIAKDEISKATTLQEELDAIKKFLGL